MVGLSKPCVKCGAVDRYPSTRKCRPCAKAWLAAHPGYYRVYARRNHLLRKFDLTPEEYDALLSAQNDVCAICLKSPGKKHLAIDHDHVTKEIRGLLCTYCNRVTIGRERNSAKLRRAADYLEDPPARRILGIPRMPESGVA
jgi:Recombination endonuclease VII